MEAEGQRGRGVVHQWGEKLLSAHQSAADGTGLPSSAAGCHLSAVV